MNKWQALLSYSSCSEAVQVAHDVFSISICTKLPAAWIQQVSVVLKEIPQPSLSSPTQQLRNSYSSSSLLAPSAQHRPNTCFQHARSRPSTLCCTSDLCVRASHFPLCKQDPCTSQLPAAQHKLHASTCAQPAQLSTPWTSWNTANRRPWHHDWAASHSSGWLHTAVRQAHATHQGQDGEEADDDSQEDEPTDEIAYWDNLDESVQGDLLSSSPTSHSHASQVFQAGHKQLFGRTAPPKALALLRLDRPVQTKRPAQLAAASDHDALQANCARTLLRRLIKLVQLMGREHALDLFLKQPLVLLRKPDSIRDNLVSLARQLDAQSLQPADGRQAGMTPAGLERALDLIKVNTRLITSARKDHAHHVAELSAALHLQPQVGARLISRTPQILSTQPSKHYDSFACLAAWLAEWHLPGPNTREPGLSSDIRNKRAFSNTAPLPITYAAVMTWQSSWTQPDIRDSIWQLGLASSVDQDPELAEAAEELARLPWNVLQLMLWPGITLDESAASVDAAWSMSQHPSMAPSSKKGWRSARAKSFAARQQELSYTVHRALPAVSVIQHLNTPSGSEDAVQQALQDGRPGQGLNTFVSQARQDALGGEGVCGGDVRSRAAAFSRACFAADPRLAVVSLRSLKERLGMLGAAMQFNPQWRVELQKSNAADVTRMLVTSTRQYHKLMEWIQKDDPSLLEARLSLLLTKRSQLSR